MKTNSIVKDIPKLIMGTIGPTFESKKDLVNSIQYNCKFFRLPFGYKDRNHISNALIVENLKTRNANISLLVDLPSDRPRLSNTQPIELRQGDIFCITEDENIDVGSYIKISITFFQHIYDKISIGDRILFFDGKIKARIIELQPQKIIAKIEIGSGVLKNGNSITICNSNIRYLPVQDDDITLLHSIESKDIKVDWIALSFVKDENDIIEAKKRLMHLKTVPKIMAKIETKEAIDNINKIIHLVDGILIARGDLCLNINIAHLFYAEKEIIKIAKKNEKIVFVATQFLESYAEKGIISRPELIDLSVASWLGADGIMLGKETVFSDRPLECIKIANFIMNYHANYNLEWVSKAKNAFKEKEYLTIAIEGPDGSGKSTLCEMIKNFSNKKVIRGIPKEFEIKDIKLRMIKTKNWISSFLYFLSGVIEMQKDECNLDDILFLDRSIWSTIVVHLKKDIARLFEISEVLNLFLDNIKFPDITIVLKSSYKKCIANISNKTEYEQNLDSISNGSEELYNREMEFFYNLKQHGIKVSFLNTGRDKDEMFENLRNLLKNDYNINI